MPFSADGYTFASLAEVMAKANEEKSGDQLAGLAAADAKERVAAKTALADVRLRAFVDEPLLPPEADELSRAFLNELDHSIYQSIADWTVGELREHLLADASDAVIALRPGLLPEMVAAVAKLMSNLDLMLAAKKLPVIVAGRSTLGQSGRLATRIQPNHPRDGVDGVLASTLEGLSFGCGDAVLGINPVDDRIEVVQRLADALQSTRERLEVPTQVSVLAHVTTQMRALEIGAPLDLLFQSVGGTQAANRAFGIDLKLLDEGDAIIRAKSRLTGPARWYFETGQGSELSSAAHAGLDQLTLEARCYGVARRYQPLLVNTVVGFIGPEYLYDARQVIRAGLEDHFMGKLLGVPMGVDVCYTNHMAADQNDLENLAVLLTAAGCNYFMALPMGDDCMLNYQSSSFHDAGALRELLDLRPAPEFEAWLESRGLMEHGRLTARAGDARVLL
ncbi:MAG: ethanolamine ammonia-lyase subunit EutB [Deltaproteobacteria bacterium]|nr:ethanolamine ammonia-lyase subunit EutB [Deltaproteobacteria bacterium]MBI3390885.1 ethanolamine ammonia-lyase subunit EutB [Deltaproteobacteria bacterium]